MITPACSRQRKELLHVLADTREHALFAMPVLRYF